ncbi:MAG: hypothetical protein HUU34_04140 [Saprospiraceae bacterium]|nr:hypothetical protein [Saprospiraceae bacterium]
MAAHKEELTGYHNQESGIQHSATYLPAEWLAIKEAGVDQPEKITAALAEYEGLEYYRMRIELLGGQGDVLQHGASNTDEYYARVSYFSFDMQKEISLIAGQDTFTCKLFHFERNYGAAPYADFMLGFDEPEGNNLDRILIYEDRVFSDAPITMTISGKNINSIPKLKL